MITRALYTIGTALLFVYYVIGYGLVALVEVFVLGVRK